MMRARAMILAAAAAVMAGCTPVVVPDQAATAYYARDKRVIPGKWAVFMTAPGFDAETGQDFQALVTCKLGPPDVPAEQAFYRSTMASLDQVFDVLEPAGGAMTAAEMAAAGYDGQILIKGLRFDPRVVGSYSVIAGPIVAEVEMAALVQVRDERGALIHDQGYDGAGDHADTGFWSCDRARPSLEQASRKALGDFGMRMNSGLLQDDGLRLSVGQSPISAPGRSGLP